MDGKEGLVDYFGDGPELLWPLEAHADGHGSLVFESGPMRLLPGPKIGMRGFMVLDADEVGLHRFEKSIEPAYRLATSA